MPTRTVQIQVENVSGTLRRIFLVAQELPVSQPVPLALAAWRSYTLDNGDSEFTAYPGTLQIAAHRSSETGNHQTVLVNTELGSDWSFQVSGDGTPLLAPEGNGIPGEISCVNQLPEGTIDVGLYSNFAQLICRSGVAPGMKVVFETENRLFLYSTVPVAGDAQPLVLEDVVEELDLTAVGSEVLVQLLQDGTTVKWRIR